MARTDHVNLPVPPGRAEQVAAFYEVVLGFSRADRPDTGREGAWLDVGDGVQVHLSEHEAAAAHPDQHVAFVVDDLDAVRGRAVAAGVAWDALAPGRAKLRDPAGNLVELFAEGAARA
jgi:catechol 2,3-dioxygenase-like lactoylglutathione lyase family enzyme